MKLSFINEVFLNHVKIQLNDGNPLIYSIDDEKYIWNL